MAGNKQLIFESVARDLTNGQLFDLVLIDGGTTYTAYVRANSSGDTPANVAQITSAGALPLIAPSGGGDVVGLGTTGNLPLWTDGPNSVQGDSVLTQVTGNIVLPAGNFNLSAGDINLTGNFQLLGTATKVGIHRATPTALLHVDSEGQQPAAVGTTPGTAGPALIRSGNAATGGETTIATTGVGGAGSLIAFSTGAGGQATAAAVASTGGDGGAFTINGGTGGAAAVAGTGSNTGGVGAAFNLNGGTGGAASGATAGANLGGAGGAFNLICGNGGNATNGGTNTGGAGGAINLTAGNGGTGATAAGIGGNVTLSAGKAGAAGVSAGAINLRTSIQNGSVATRLGIEAASGAVVLFGPLTAPSAGVDQTKLYTADAAAGDNNLYAVNEAGKDERLTGLATRVSTQFDSTNQTPANITGLSFNLQAGKSYSFEAELFTTSDVAGGVKIAMGGTATATAIIYEILVIDAGLTALQSRQTALAGAGGVTAVTAALVKVTGTITVNQAGTLTVQFSRNAATATSSVLVGSYFRLIPQGS